LALKGNRRRAARKVRSEYETVLNMKTAKALGLDVPTSILLSADELIDRNTATQEDWIADGGNGS
jgi:hypothetical protein